MSETRCTRRILIAVDESRNSAKALDYVIHMLGGHGEVAVDLLHIIQEPEEDFFPDDNARAAWMKDREDAMRRLLDGYADRLRQAGFTECGVKIRLVVRQCASVSACILDEASSGRCDAIVVGRQGISAKEEFLFGSVSSAIVHRARGVAVWVVN